MLASLIYDKADSSSNEDPQKKLDNLVKQIQLLTHKGAKDVATLRAGMFFGELALINNEARAATIVCKTDCYFGVLSREDYSSSIGKIQDIANTKYINFMRNCP